MFKNILIPVDFEINTEMAVKKALEICDPNEAVIHLFHVRKPVTSIYDYRHIEDRLFQWKKLIEENYSPVKVDTSICLSVGVQRSIIIKAKDLKADLIIIGKHSYHKWITMFSTVFPNKIAKATGCPVLTFKPGSIYTKIRSIVVPIGPAIPQRKVDLIVELEQKFQITIHLVTVVNKKQNTNKFSAYSLFETYRFLKEKVQCPVDHEVLHGENVAKSTYDYARSIKADLMLVEPESETRLSSFPQKHIIDELKPTSKLQILAVQS